VQNKLILCDLDFVNVPDHVIQQLFYNEQRHSTRSIDASGNIMMPPLALRRSAQQIRQFFEWGKAQKREQILPGGY
jgi:hypothetical protein